MNQILNKMTEIFKKFRLHKSDSKFSGLAMVKGKTILNPTKFSPRLSIPFILIFAGLGAYVVFFSKAATVFLAVSPESGTITNPATVGTDAAAVGGQFVQFGSTGGGGTPTITGTAYYVDCAGSDGNPGTATKNPDGTINTISPWQSLNKANAATLAPGDGILFKRGCTWTGTLTAKWTGTATSPVILSAYGTGNLPVFKNDGVTANWNIVNVTGSYQNIDSLEAIASINNKVYVQTKDSSGAVNYTCTLDSGGGAGYAFVGHVVGFHLATGAKNNKLSQVVARGGYAGVYLNAGAENNRVTASSLLNNSMMSPVDAAADGQPGGQGDAGAFGVLIWGSNNEIDNNQINDSNACSYDYVLDGAAIEIYGGSSTATSNNNIHHNKAVNDNAFTELGKSSSAPAPNNNVFAYNTYYAAGISNSIFLASHGNDQYGPVTGVKMYNNTAYMTGTSKNGIWCGGGSACDASILVFKNNIIATNNTTPIPVYAGNSNNLGWVIGSGTNDPKFVNAGAQDFRLQSTSPAKDAGTSESVTAGYTKDLDNHSVPAGSAVDIGAYEYGSVAINTGSSKSLLERAVSAVGNAFAGLAKIAANVWQSFASYVSSIFTNPPVQAQSTGSITIAAVGDMNPDNNTSATSASGKNAAAIKAGLANGSLDYFFGLGDFQYQNATCNTLVNYWGSLWKDVIPKTYHIGGPNHDWDTSSTYNPAVPGYKEYFNGQCAGQANKSAAVTAKGSAISPIEFYSFDVGNWHFAALPTGLWRISSTQASQITAQLDADLAAAKAAGKHLGAMYHDPYYTSSTSSHNRETAVKPWIDVMDKYDVRLTLSGSQHNYERSCPVLKDDSCTPQEGTGTTAFQVSTGGIGLRSFTSLPSYIKEYDPINLSNPLGTRFSDTHGWLKLTLNNDGSFSWAYNPVQGTKTDSGSRVAPGGAPPTPDSTPPTTSITSPAGGPVSGPLDITANANDNVGVTRVEFYDGTTKLGEDTSSPYQYTWNTTTATNGPHSLTTKAFDAAGNVGNSSAVSVTVNNGCAALSNPYGSSTVTVNVPQAGTYRLWSRVMVPDSTNNSYTFQTDGVCNMTVGDSSISPGAWVWVDHKDGSTANKADINLTAGSHALILAGRESGVKLDHVLLLSDSCVPVDNGDNCTGGLDVTAPNVAISSPAEGAPLTGTTTIAADATDNIQVAKVEFYDGTTKLGEDTTSPYSYSWNTTTATNGAHSLTAKAYDNASAPNSRISNAVNVSVSNTTPPPTCSTKPGDINGDNAVNISDISALLSAYGLSTTTNCADLDKNGTVNIADLSIILSKYGT